MSGPLARHLLLRHGAAGDAGRARGRGAPAAAVAHGRLAAAKDVPEPEPRAGPDRLPVQRAGLRLVVRRADQRKRHRTMRTQLHQIVADSARRRASAPALTFKDATLTYGELWDEVAAFAAGLGELGLERGERVGIYLDKRIETVVSIFGTSAAGGVFVPINPVLKAKQVAYILDDCSVRVLVTTAERFEVLRDELGQTAVEHVVVLGAAPEAAADLQLHAWDVVRRRRRDPGARRHRRRHGGDPLHLGQHRQAEGRRALAPQPAVRRRERQPVPRQRRGRRHPRRPAAQLRRRLQPAHDRVHGRRPRRARQLPAGARRRPPVRQAPGHRAHVRAAAVDPAHRAGVAGRGDAQPALLRQHRRAHAALDARASCARSSPAPSPS